MDIFLLLFLVSFADKGSTIDAHDEKIDELNAKRISELISFSKLINADTEATSSSSSDGSSNLADGRYHDIHAKLLIIPEKAVNKLTHVSKQQQKEHTHLKNSSDVENSTSESLTTNKSNQDTEINEISSNLRNASSPTKNNVTTTSRDTLNLPVATEAVTIQAEDKNVLKNQQVSSSSQQPSRLLLVKPLTLQIDNVTFQTEPFLHNVSVGHHKGHRRAHTHKRNTTVAILKEKSSGNETTPNNVSPSLNKTGASTNHTKFKVATDEKKEAKLYAGNKQKDNGSKPAVVNGNGEVEMVKGIEITALNEVKYKHKGGDGEDIVKPLNDTLDLHKNVTYMRNKQNDDAKDLEEALSKLRFNNGPSGKVKAGQEFAYLSQCGLYTESQNVSYVQHSWATKIYSPYFYLYEKPKKYEKCKPLAWMNGTDMRGNVFLSFEVKSLRGSTMENNAKICEKYCCKEPRCAAWVLRLQSDATSNCPADSYCCWLKTDVPKMEPHEACVSGIIKREHYKAPPTGMRSSVPLGALGTGSFEMRADGTFHEWTVENQSPGGSAKLSKTSLELMLLGVRVKKGKSKAKAAVFRTHAPHGFEGVDTLQYFGSHPVSKLKIGLHKSFKKDLKMNMYAYSTFHPRQPKESATPAVAFSLSVTNPSNEEMDVSFMMTIPFGFNDDTIRRGNNFAEVAFTRLVSAADCQKACANKVQCMSWTTNGPFSCMLKDGMPLHAYEYGIISGLKGEWAVEDGMLNCKRPGFYPQSGDISLFPVNAGSEITSFGVSDDTHAIWNTFNKTGKVTNTSTVNVTALNGAVSTTTKLKPKETKLLTIILAWYFPHRDLSEERVGNFYNNLFKSSVEVAKHYEKDLKSSIDEIQKWQDTIMPPSSLSAESKDKDKGKSASKRDKRVKHPACNFTINGINTVPDCLQDILLNSLSTLRSGMWMENGRWRQWEAYDCANLDPVHVNLHRVIPYVIFYPGLAKQLMLAWADHQLEDGMIQESLSIGCLEDTSKEGVAGGRLMIDVNVGFVVQSYMIYSWTNDTEFFDEIYPFSVRAIKWLIKDSTKGTGLPYRKGDAYDLFELEKYDHSAYNSIMYLLGLRTMLKMSLLQKDRETFNVVNSALARAEKQFDVEMWDDRREFYHAWFDDEWGSPSWLMSDSFYGQVWAYTLGVGPLVELEKLRKHLKKEAFRNDSPYGLKVISKSRAPVSIEDTSVILGEEVSSCKSLENITKTESIWMTSSTDWSSLQLHLGLDPEDALQQASKSLDNYRTNLRDQWNFHGVTSSEHYGLDGLPWATSHYTFQLVLWHLPLALSGQQYYAPNGTITFHPKFDPPYWIPFYTPACMGNIGAKHIDVNGKDEILYSLKATSGSCTFEGVSISDEKYTQVGGITIREGDQIEWSAPAKTKKDVVKAILEQLKKH